MSDLWRPLHKYPLFHEKKNQSIDIKIPSCFLSKPRTRILSPLLFKFPQMTVGHASMQGFRVAMEDNFLVSPLSIEEHYIVGVMDGHAGSDVSKFVARRLGSFLELTESWKNYKRFTNTDSPSAVEILSKALVEAFILVDAELLRHDGLVSLISN